MQTPIVHIAIDADGHPRTINRQVKVHMLAKKHRSGVSVKELAAHYQITLADVYAALAYYHDNRAYFDQREAAIAPLVEQAKQRSAELRTRVEQRLEDASHQPDDD